MAMNLLQRFASTTIKDYGLGFEETVARDLPIYAMLKEQKRFSFNHSGDGFDWAVQFKRGTPVGNRGDKPLKFAPINRFSRPKLDYRGFAEPDAMSLLEKMANRGKPALIKYIDEMKKRLYDDMGRKFATQPWNNGNNDTESLQGVESFFFYNGNSVNYQTGLVQAFSAADYVVAPSQNYAGLQTDLGFYGGTGGITGTWPVGFQATNDGDTFDFFTPIDVNYLSTSMLGSTHDWAHQGDEAIRYLITATTKDTSKRGILDIIALDLGLWRQLKQFYATTATAGQQRIIVENSRLRKLGFNDSIEIDGVSVTGQFGIPPGVGYGFNIDQMEYRSMFPQLFYTQGPEYHMESQTDRVACNCLGNFQFYSPKYFGKLAGYTSTPM